MVIRDKDNFVPIMAKMLSGLGYEEVKMAGKGSPIDITATKDGKRYCFKCKYDIDAIGEKYITELYEASKDGKFDVVVFMTNSSFISSAKKKGEACNIELWDRNTIDRLYVGVSDTLEEKEYEPQGGKGALIAVVAIVVLIALFAVYWFFIRKFLG